MSQKKKAGENPLSRREFIRTAGLTGLSSVFAFSAGLTGPAGLSGAAFAQQSPTPAVTPAATPLPQVPTRVFGKTGVAVPILSLGGIFDITANQIMLKKAIDFGVTYWDTANGYVGGKSEEGIGMFFKKFPESRKKVFLVTKSHHRNAAGLDEHLALSFTRMNTDYIDLLFLHGLKSADELTPELKAWAAKAKAEKKIRFFGFSTHRNMADVMLAASKLDWIDGIMTTYNYRVKDDEKMKAAIEACHKAGIGLTAMKTQGGRSRSAEGQAEQQLAEKFIQKGFTPQQANLKVIWEDTRIACICSAMYNMTILLSNVAAALDKAKLEVSDLHTLKRYAEETCSGYCAGCSDLCDAAMGVESRIADVMRYMMYYHSYGEAVHARQLFAALPAGIRKKLAVLDYSAAERVCPQRIAIGEVMKEAVRLLA